MNIILASGLGYYTKNDQGERRSTIIKNKNRLLSVIKKHLPAQNTVVFVANRADNEENDIRSSVFFEALDKTGLRFVNKIILDARNKDKASTIISEADFVFITGGRILPGKEFYDEIRLKDLLSHCKGVIMGVSAGSMLLCKDIYNFPETAEDEFDTEYVEGMGLVQDIIFVPHFDGKTLSYQGHSDRDVVNESILPYSYKIKMTALPNGSYIFVNNNGMRSYGKVYELSNGKANKIKIRTKF